MIRDKTMADALAAYTGTVTPCPPGRPAMTRRRRHLPATPARQCFWLYDGRDLLAIIEQRADGWHVLMRGRGDIGTLPTRALAVSMVEARQAKKLQPRPSQASEPPTAARPSNSSPSTAGSRSSRAAETKTTCRAQPQGPHSGGEPNVS